MYIYIKTNCRKNNQILYLFSVFIIHNIAEHIIAFRKVIICMLLISRHLPVFNFLYLEYNYPFFKNYILSQIWLIILCSLEPFRMEYIYISYNIIAAIIIQCMLKNCLNYTVNYNIASQSHCITNIYIIHFQII